MSEGPRISIGLPVCNGQHHVAEAIESILAQSYRNFELIISDNASTDDTAAICQRYAAADPRIRYHREPVNIGASANFNRTFELSEGTYFKWAAHDDVLEPTYLEKCVALLEQHPDAVLCQSLVRIIDDEHRPLAAYDHSAYGTDSPVRAARFRARLRPRDCQEIFGLIRSEVLRSTVLIDDHLGGDRTLLVELALIGRFLLVPEFLFLNREHPRRFKRQHRHPTKELAWYTPGKANEGGRARWRMLRTWVLYAKALQAVRRHVGTLPERMRCYGHLLASARFRERWQYLLCEPLLLLDPTLVDRAKRAKRSLIHPGAPREHEGSPCASPSELGRP